MSTQPRPPAPTPTQPASVQAPSRTAHLSLQHPEPPHSPERPPSQPDPDAQPWTPGPHDLEDRMTTNTPLPTLPWEPYQQAVADRDRLEADLNQTDRDLARLAADRPAAYAADDAAQTAAARTGAKDPGRKASTQAAKETEAAKERRRVLDLALAQANAACLHLVRSQPEDADQAAAQAVQEAAARYQASLAGLEAARTAFHAATYAQAWVQDGARFRWKITAAPGLYVPGVVSQNGDPVPVQAVLEALERESLGALAYGHPASSTLFAGDQRVNTGVRNVAVRVTDPATGEKATAYVPPTEAAALNAAEAAKVRSTLERDHLENVEAAQAYAQAEGLPDPFADLREPAAT